MTSQNAQTHCSVLDEGRLLITIRGKINKPNEVSFGALCASAAGRFCALRKNAL